MFQQHNSNKTQTIQEYNGFIHLSKTHERRSTMEAILDFLTDIPLLGTLLGWIIDGVTGLWEFISNLF